MDVVVSGPHPRMGVVVPRAPLLIFLQVATAKTARRIEHLLHARFCKVSLSTWKSAKLQAIKGKEPTYKCKTI